VFRRCRNPYRAVAGSQTANGTVAEPVILARVGDFAEVDADTARKVTADLLAANSTRLKPG
jgi:hypothetical protein